MRPSIKRTLDQPLLTPWNTDKRACAFGSDGIR